MLMNNYSIIQTINVNTNLKKNEMNKIQFEIELFNLKNKIARFLWGKSSDFDVDPQICTDI